MVTIFAYPPPGEAESCHSMARHEPACMCVRHRSNMPAAHLTTEVFLSRGRRSLDCTEPWWELANACTGVMEPVVQSQELYEELEGSMLQRLRDKQPAVRAHASRVLTAASSTGRDGRGDGRAAAAAGHRQPQGAGPCDPQCPLHTSCLMAVRSNLGNTICSALPQQCTQRSSAAWLACAGGPQVRRGVPHRVLRHAARVHQPHPRRRR